jgi:hypothetical protein
MFAGASESFKLPDLPYDYGELEPVISAEAGDLPILRRPSLHPKQHFASDSMSGCFLPTSDHENVTTFFTKLAIKVFLCHCSFLTSLLPHFYFGLL